MGIGRTGLSIFFLLFIAGCISFSYSKTLHSPFLLDDYGNIVGNHFIEIEKLSLDGLLQVWSGEHIANNRKISYLTFALNYLFGQYDPFGYHLANIGIHICCSVLLFLFFCQTLNTSWLKKKI